MLAGAPGLLLLAGPWGAVGTPVAPRGDLWLLQAPLQSQTKAPGVFVSVPDLGPAGRGVPEQRRGRCFPSSWELFPSSSEGSCRGWFSSTPSLSHSSGGAYRRALPVPRMCVGCEVGLCLLTLGATWWAGLGEHLQSVLRSSSSLAFGDFHPFPCPYVSGQRPSCCPLLGAVVLCCAELPGTTGAGETPRGCPGNPPRSSPAGECCLLGAPGELLWVTLSFTGGERGRTGLVLPRYPPPLLVKWHRAGKSSPKSLSFSPSPGQAAMGTML